jgi:hypothetical protein
MERLVKPGVMPNCGPCEETALARLVGSCPDSAVADSKQSDV